MSSAGTKRLRDEANVVEELKQQEQEKQEKQEKQNDEKAEKAEPWSLLSGLALRCSEDWMPEVLKPEADEAGVKGIDAWLMFLGRSIADARATIPAQAEIARAKLGSLRAALVAATLRCDEMRERIDDAEAAKTASLDRELCAVDETLTQMREMRAAAAPLCVALASFLPNSGAEQGKAPALSKAVADAQRLEHEFELFEDTLGELPTCVVEPPVVDFIAHDNVLEVGSVVAPRAATAEDFVDVEWTDISQIRYKLTSERLDQQTAEETELTLRAAAETARCEA